MAVEMKWKKRSENKLIGKDIQRIDGAVKSSGAAKYTADVHTPGTLIAKLVTCKHAHAKLKKIDLSVLEKQKGVKAWHQFVQVDGEIFYDGTMVVAIAAERAEQADDAVKALEATIEYEVLPHWVDEADREGAEKAGRLKKLGRNAKSAANADDVDAGLKDALAKAKHVHKGSYGIVTISHMCLEPHGSHCEFKGDNLDVHLSTQNVSGTPAQFAEPLGLDVMNVTVTADYEGGGFGSKFAAGDWGIACAKMAQQAGKPVRLMLDRATELKIAGIRPSAFNEVTIACDEEGQVVAWDSVHWGSDGQAGGGVNVTQLPYVFDFANRASQQYGIVCDTGKSQAWRAPPHPQLCALTQTAMFDLAMKAGMDPYDFFAKNLDSCLNKKGPVYAEEMAMAAKEIGWKENMKACGPKASKGPVKRGLGLALHTWGGGAGACTCTVRVNPDGTVASFVGSQDIGTGTRTVISIVLAESFGIPMSAVKVNLGSSKYPASAASGGSITVGGVSGAHRRAALTALADIYEKVKTKYNLDSADGLSAKDEAIFNGDKKVCTWKEACTLLGNMPLEVQGKGPAMDGLTSAVVGGVQMADVTVDTETGLVRINKFVCVQDCGLIIDELTARSQCYGGLIMGLSYALMEERIMDNKTGRYINADLENYKLPRVGDIGELSVIMYQPDSEYDRGVIGLGEPPVISPGACISNAVAHAIGVRVPTLPLTPKRVLDALKGANA